VCQQGFAEEKPLIGNLRKVDWDVAKYDGTRGQYLDFWTAYLSYALLHELIHLKFDCGFLLVA
jgi:hypothetical protein